MGYKRKLIGKIGPIKKCEDGCYRTKDGVLIISKNHPETWYDKNDPASADEQWAEIQRRLNLKAVLVAACYISAFIALTWCSCN